MRFEMTGAKNPRVVGFDHWGAAERGLQLGEIERAFMQPCRDGEWRDLARPLISSFLIYEV